MVDGGVRRVFGVAVRRTFAVGRGGRRVGGVRVAVFVRVGVRVRVRVRVRVGVVVCPPTAGIEHGVLMAREMDRTNEGPAEETEDHEDREEAGQQVSGVGMGAHRRDAEWGRVTIRLDRQ